MAGCAVGLQHGQDVVQRYPVDPAVLSQAAEPGGVLIGSWA